MKSYSIALIPGDGIGRDVTAAAWTVLETVAHHSGFAVTGTEFPWSCKFYKETGRMMSEDGIETLRGFDAILLGAVGWPAEVPDSVSLHGLLLPIRKAFVQYANIRPHRLLPGVTGPLRKENFDILCIRENTEGEYSGAGGRVHQGTREEVAVETSIFTRAGVERILRFGFEQAGARRGKLASVTKSNAQKYSMVFWDEITRKLAAEYADVEVTSYHVDALAARMIMAPESLDVLVASNLFGDILTDIGAAIQGGLGYAASANINPDRSAPSMFEPVHGSAPDIAHLGIANPIATIWSGAMMLEHLGETAAAGRIMKALEATTARGIGTTAGKDKTDTITAAIVAALS
ncbi:tartrate dehydrogenase [Mesorhizobium sp. M2D.F.Ca.ET.185.01.1.1]|uniref:tartrate dehydrogenase n=1 Tax=unclassified Mesorhizobium TaxID=325217 RepID=UPI000FCA2227|nr:MULTISPECIES: tartrate dehydrogenase [unclassified Mesorhizobium]TGP73881.1 tartrate dehydrogenase [bacterium M00.F.Ca.ET.227.01.1.1]TGP85758.1 tartrate dehydrogenase [bacterium M00.F.Ca.ET.221.01.1.1]TGP90985.1 tartrate dehydrogenase [bacterium M00.F.Ca.ET.222.01.1.1]TGT68788.1 tartrate dehydrogenase [bacterium M00.F.Ca.ET.159.01.1.1]TGT80637.1 tartrate dehydrogenase [bacterium M00.F.Ca.ET.157.01.1.1]TGU03060.1 tartrate dehydrogenase [bacterium M00.F.Ca.ET.163.01.1.1]TGU20291.1 tartrate 